MNILIGKTSSLTLSAFALLLSMLVAPDSYADSVEENSAGECGAVAGGATAVGAVHDSGNPVTREKKEDSVYVFHLAKFPEFHFNLVRLQGSDDDGPDLESLFSLGFLGWELNIWRADKVMPGKYEFIVEPNHDGIFGEWYERKPVTVSQTPCVLWDYARFVPVTISCETDFPGGDQLLFGYTLRGSVGAGKQQRCFISRVFSRDDTDMKDELWLNEDITDFKLQFLVDRRGNGKLIAGKEFALGDAKSLRMTTIHVDIQYGIASEALSPPKGFLLQGVKIRMSDEVQGTVTITSPNGESRVLR